MLLVETKEQVDFYIQNLIDRKASFEVHERNGQKKVLWDKKKNLGVMYRGRLSDGDMQMLWIYSAVKKQMVARMKSGMEFDFNDAQLNPQRRNHDLYNSMEIGTRFTGIDMKHAYWRMAFLKDYISRNLYTRLLDDKYKLSRNKALACLTSRVKVKIYEHGELFSEYDEGNPVLTQIYFDIRTSTYQILFDIAEKLGNQYFLKYHTDCLYVITGVEKVVQADILSAKMTFSTSECYKTDNQFYLEKEKEKKDFEVKKF